MIVDLDGWFTGPSARRRVEWPVRAARPRAAASTPASTRPVCIRAARSRSVTASPDAAASVSPTSRSPSRPTRVRHRLPGRARRDRPPSTVNPAFFDHTVANLAITRISDRGLAYWSLARRRPRRRRHRLLRRHAGASPRRRRRQHARRVAGPDRRRLDARRSRRLPPTSQSGAARFRRDRRRRVVPATAATVVSRATPTRSHRTPPSRRSLTTPGTLDIVVVKTGYNDWFSDFPRRVRRRRACRPGRRVPTRSSG